MSAPQGIMSFPGLTDYILSVQFSLQHGISPSIGTVTCAPVPPRQIVENGTLDIRYGNDRLTFPECKIDKIDAYRNEDGFERWAVSILDRRWKWKFAGVVNGHWNERKGERLVGQKLAKPTVRSVKQLAEICLDAMGEERYDTSQLFFDIFPEVRWEFTNAAQALASLCDQFGFRVVLTINNTVAICKVGVGKQLPNTGDEVQISKTLDPPEKPAQIIFAGSPDRYQYDLELEPVLRDFDNGWKHINDLSYAPRDAEGTPSWGVGAFNQFTAAQIAVNPRLKLVNTYITNNLYRTWRIKEPFEIEIWDNRAGALKLQKLNRFNILPLEATLMDTETVDKGAGDPLDPFVVVEKEPLLYGLYYTGHGGDPLSRGDLHSTYHVTPAGDFREIEPTGDVATAKDPLDPAVFATGKCAKALYNLAWDLDRETGFVQLSDDAIRKTPAVGEMDHYIRYDMNLDGATLPVFSLLPAKLWLRVAFSVRFDQQQGSPHLFRGVLRKMPGNNGTGYEYVRAPDVRFKAGRFKDGPIALNEEEFTTQAKHYLDAKQKEYDLADFASATYPGFKAINPDGALQQISWEVTDRGFAFTRASRNKEEVFAGVSYTERRLFEKTKALIDADAKRKVGG